MIGQRTARPSAAFSLRAVQGPVARRPPSLPVSDEGLPDRGGRAALDTQSVPNPKGNVAAEGGLILGLDLLGAAFGAWVSGMIGSIIPNTQLKRFDKDLEAGRILLMVDVHEDRLPEIRELIRKHHIEAKDNGLEPEIPVFP